MKLVTVSILFFVSCSVATAATWTITFGGGVGFAYSPNTLSVSVGDTIVWSGDFSFHPLESDPGGIPAGAAGFGSSSGSTFKYVVTMPGNYGYHCAAHGSPGDGMFGSFTAIAASVEPVWVIEAELMQSYPNPAIGSTNISFRLLRPSDIELKVYDLKGNEIATLASGMLANGTYTIPFDTTPLGAGVYFYSLAIYGEAVTREMIVTK